MTREYFTNEFLKHIQTTDSIMSTRGYKELCQEVLDTRAEIDRLIDNNAKFQEMATRKMTDLRAELARRDEQTTKHLAWMAEQGNTITGLRNELKDRDERIAELEAMINPASFDKYLVSRIKDPGVAEDYARVRIEDKTNYEIIEKQADIITRLKEDAERLIWRNPNSTICICGYPDFRDAHAADCPITLHRALMKELENG